MSASEFAMRFEEFLGRHGRPPDVSVFALVERWEDLVADSGDCYLYGWYEFVNDCGVRTLLEQAFGDEALNPSTELESVRGRVDAADAAFRANLRQDVQATGGNDAPWWTRGILVRAGDEFADDVSRLFGVTIERC